jgi:hypothetical protein
MELSFPKEDKIEQTIIKLKSNKFLIYMVQLLIINANILFIPSLNNGLNCETPAQRFSQRFALRFTLQKMF